MTHTHTIDARAHATRILTARRRRHIAYAGIFGEGADAPQLTPRGTNRSNASSVQGGIFAEPAPAPTNAAPTRNMTKSSVEGGIFGAPQVAPPPTASKMTASGVEGGIFGGYGHKEPSFRFAAQPAPVPTEERPVAGAAIIKGPALTFDESAPAPLQPLKSARSNPNESSIQGGIFGSAPLPHKPAVARGNPNASSIEGGIFG